MTTLDLSALTWRKSSFSGGSGSGDACVEAGAVFFTRAEMAAYLAGVKAGEFDDLT